MNTDKTILNMSSHPTQKQRAAFKYYIIRLISLHVTQKEKAKHWVNIFTMAKNKGHLTEQFIKMKEKLTQKFKVKTQTNKMEFR